MIIKQGVKKALPILIIAVVIIILTIAAGVWLYFENNRIDSSVYEIPVSGLPKEYNGFRIVQISDFHNNVLGKDNEKLMDAVQAAKPDIIVITGDFIDSRNTHTDISLNLSKQLVEVAPVYYVTGNHEHRMPDILAEFETELQKLGVHVLHGESQYITREGKKLQIIGVDDPTFYYPDDEFEGKESEELAADVKRLCDSNCSSILLAHRPVFFDDYAAAGVDVSFAGHEHGGQFRVPFIGGIFAPDEGLMPKYCEGVHTIGDSTLVVSRGLGQSVFPFRVNNSPELVTAVLKCK